MAAIAVRVVGVLVLLWSSIGLAAAGIPGREAPAFEAALEQWLADDEAGSLPELAGLAAEGNAAAQMLLALIDRTPSLQGPWLARLPRAERDALLRRPEEATPRNWMAAAVAAEPTAALWQRFWEGEASAELALDFAEAGEPDMAARVLLVRSVQRRSGLAEHAGAPGFPPALRALALLDPLGPPEDETVRPIDPEDPQRGYLETPPPDALLGQWLMSAPEALPVAAFCRDACGGAPSCALAAYRALGGHAGVIAAAAPSARLIDPARFAASTRGQCALLRRVLLRKDARGRASLIAATRKVDACFADHLEAEAQRYATGNGVNAINDAGANTGTNAGTTTGTNTGDGG